MNGKNEENARAEYSAAHDAYMHYDNFTWQVGSVLIAGIFVYWGFIISNPLGLLSVLLGNLTICLFMSCWLLYAEHNRQIYLFKLHRIHELEAQLGLSQHRRFKKWPDQGKVYVLNQPTGHYIDDAIYVIVSLGGLLPSLLEKDSSQWFWHHWLFLVLTVLIVIAVIWRVHYVDAKTKDQIENIEKKASKALSETPNNELRATR